MLTSIVSFCFVSSFILFLIQHQKNPRKGGSLAPSKRFWLFYTLFTWFIFIPLSLYEAKVSPPYILSFRLLTISMWIRGGIELIMMYLTKNWTPPLGIAHNLLTFTLFVSCLSQYEQIRPDIELFFFVTVGISLLLETYYAIAFYKVVKEKTKGDEAIWFVNKENPQFKTILLFTHFFNYPLYFGLILVFWKYHF